MVAAWLGHDIVCHMLLNKNANVHTSPLTVNKPEFHSALDAAINALAHVADDHKDRGRYERTAVLMIQQRARFGRPRSDLHISNFIKCIIPLLNILRNSGSLTNAKIHWESLMFVIINMPPTTDNGIMINMEDIAIRIMKLRGYATQKPLAQRCFEFSKKHSVFHLAAYNGFKKLLNFLLRCNKAYLMEKWIVNDNLSSFAQPLDDIVAKLRSWRKGSQITYFTEIRERNIVHYATQCSSL